MDNRDKVIVDKTRDNGISWSHAEKLYEDIILRSSYAVYCGKPE